MSFDERPQDDPTRNADAPGQPGYQQPGYQQPGYGQPGYGPEPTRYPLQPGYYPNQQPAYGVLRDNSDATLALILSLVGLAAGLLVVSPFAWWKANQALAQIEAAPGVYGNRSMAVAGQIMGIIGTVLLGIAVVFGVGLVLLFVFSLSSFALH
jgi:hypothetical protein